MSDGGGGGGGGGAASSDGSDASVSESTAAIERRGDVAAAREGNDDNIGVAATGGIETDGAEEATATGAVEGTRLTTEPLASLKGSGGSDALGISTNGSDSGNESKVDEDGEEVVDCSICMCAVTGEEDAASLDKCTHAFHFACIVKWGETTNQCPMCKVRHRSESRVAVSRVRA